MINTETRLRRLERIVEISRELTSTVALGPLLHKIVKMAAELSGSQSASILLLDPHTGELRFCAMDGDPSGQMCDIPVPVEDSIAGAVLVSGKPAIISDTHTDPRHYEVVGKQTGFETNSLLAVPLRIKERCIGVLEAVNKQGEDTFDQEDVEMLTALAAHAAVAIDNARLVGALRGAYGRLKELDQLKSDFIAIASHELRTPLGVILGYATMLQEQLGEAAGPQLDAVLRASLRLKYIIETMLNLRYLETGRMEIVPTCVDLRVEVREA
ncbi:MAG: GAF domain-containing protein, partial [Anaerolineae bacterium]|nr:GAF domain-containing protein [Anaerolineae bacterium]